MLMQDKKLEPGPSPREIKNVLSFVPPVIFDVPGWRRSFGDCVGQPAKIARPGNIVTATFVSTLFLFGFINNKLINVTRKKRFILRPFSSLFLKWKKSAVRAFACDEFLFFTNVLLSSLKYVFIKIIKTLNFCLCLLINIEGYEIW